MVVSAIAFKGGREILAEARESTQVGEADAS
jgi:hypothetical protein